MGPCHINRLVLQVSVTKNRCFYMIGALFLRTDKLADLHLHSWSSTRSALDKRTVMQCYFMAKHLQKIFSSIAGREDNGARYCNGIYVVSKCLNHNVCFGVTDPHRRKILKF